MSFRMNTLGVWSTPARAINIRKFPYRNRHPGTNPFWNVSQPAPANSVWQNRLQISENTNDDLEKVRDRSDGNTGEENALLVWTRYKVK